MLCNSIENGKNKCVEYWKANTNKHITNFNVQIEQETEYNSILTFRKITLSLSASALVKKQSRSIVQIQFKGWNDHSIPNIKDTYDSFIEMFNVVNDHLTNHYKLKEQLSPIVVHCSAGVGRTGTFLSMYVLFYEIITNKEFSIWNLVRKLKEMRRCLVENNDQYQFIYQFVIEFMSKRLISMEKKNTK